MQTKLKGLSDAFVTKIDPTGHSILFSTFLGGSDDDVADAIHVNAAGNDIRVAGYTSSSDFPTIHSLSPTSATSTNPDGFVTSIVISEPDLAIAMNHSGDFVQATGPFDYTIRVTNAGTAPTTGTVTVADTLPEGMVATSMSGSGWTCNAATVTCTTTTPLEATQSFPDITLTLSVYASIAGTVTNTATVSGGGETNPSNDTTSDQTTILPMPRRRSVRHS